jgi:hypothetical protein
LTKRVAFIYLASERDARRGTRLINDGARIYLVTMRIRRPVRCGALVLLRVHLLFTWRAVTDTLSACARRHLDFIPVHFHSAQKALMPH